MCSSDEAHSQSFETCRLAILTCEYQKSFMLSGWILVRVYVQRHRPKWSFLQYCHPITKYNRASRSVNQWITEFNLLNQCCIEDRRFCFRFDPDRLLYELFLAICLDCIMSNTMLALLESLLLITKTSYKDASLRLILVLTGQRRRMISKFCVTIGWELEFTAFSRVWNLCGLPRVSIGTVTS